MGIDDNIRGIFYEALEVLGINDVRYSHMPFSLRKKTLGFDIYKLASEEMKFSYIQDDQFNHKDLFEYSQEEFESHNQIIHACIALVCLGNNEYAKPLLGYLDFPETRWTIKIDFLLSRLVGSTHDYFKVPTYNERLDWQTKFIESFFYERLADLSELIWPRHTDNSANFFRYITKDYHESGLANISSILGKSNLKDELDCAEYYYIHSYRWLSNNDYHKFISFIDTSLDEEKIPFMDTIVNTVVDVFYDLELKYAPSFWKTMLDAHEIEALHSIFFYKIFKRLYVNQNWASFFIGKYFEESTAELASSYLAQLYDKDQSSDLIPVISELLKNVGRYTDPVKNTVFDLNPYYRYITHSFITNMYQSEKESLLLAFNLRKKGKDILQRSVTSRFQENTYLLILACDFAEPVAHKENFLPKIKDLIRARLRWEKQCLNLSTADLITEYTEIYKALLKHDTKDFNADEKDTIDIF